MAVDTVTPRSRRALLLGALGGLAASAAAFVRPASTRAGTDGDVVLDATNSASGTTEIDGDGADAVLQVANETGVGVLGGSGGVSFPDPIDPSTGVYGISETGVGVYGASDTGYGIYAANNAATKAAIAAEGDPGTAIHGHCGPGPIPASLANTAIYASAVGSRHGIQSRVEGGIALQALSTGSVGIIASGAGAGVAGASSGDLTGVVGWSTNQAPPAGVPAATAKTGVYGEAMQDASAHGVFGKSTLGEGVHGEATTGVGVKAVATTGAALDVAGRAVFSRSGKAQVPKNAASVDVTVPGGLAGSPTILATLQIKRGSVHVLAARPNYPSAGKVRIYLSGVAAKTVSTPVAWWVLG